MRSQNRKTETNHEALQLNRRDRGAVSPIDRNWGTVDTQSLFQQLGVIGPMTKRGEDHE